jgi:L-lactate dehydrogenase complex protein LldG
MSSREQILNALRGNTRECYDMPDLSEISPITFDNPVEQFVEKATTTAGAKVIEMADGESIDDIVRRAYPEAKIIASNLPDVTAQLNPDMVSEAQELASADVGVIKGDIGVAENACIWIPQTMREKAVCFASEYLVIMLNRKDIVNNMHEAYALIDASDKYFQQYKFGTFISGPSKTADIESALVYGAQAARGVTIVLI